MSLFSGFIRRMDMRPLVQGMESERGVESEVAQLRRGDPNALSALLMRCEPFGSSQLAAQVLHCLSVGG